MQESLFELIQQAQAMLLDRSKAEADLIYHIAKMDSEERTAIIIAYRGIYEKQEGESHDSPKILDLSNRDLIG